MNNKIYSIVYSPTEENYIGALVSMSSALKNNKNNKIKFYIIVENSFDKTFIPLFEAFKNHGNCVDVVFKYIDSNTYKKALKGLPFNNDYFIFEYANLVEEDQFLYLKANSLVNGELETLFNTDVEDCSCLATECLHPEFVKNVLNNCSDTLPINHMLLINKKGCI